MPSEINQLFDASSALTITLASLASSTSGVGRQSDVVDNTAAGTKYKQLIFHVAVTVGTTPTANRAIRFYLIRVDADGSPHRDDGAGASDAGITIINSQAVYTLFVPATTSDVSYKGSFVVDDPGPKWAVAVVHDTGVNLNSTAGNHYIRYVGVNPEGQ